MNQHSASWMARLVAGAELKQAAETVSVQQHALQQAEHALAEQQRARTEAEAALKAWEAEQAA